MTTLLQQAGNARRKSRRGPLVSAALHASAVALLILAGVKAPRVVPVHNPGSAEGKHILLTFSTGAAQSIAESTIKKQVVTATRAPSKQKIALLPSAAESKPMAEQGSGSAGLTGLGQGNVTFAAVKVFPRPQPDLSHLPHGYGGTIILNAVIDARGSISELTVLQSLSDSVDEQVMATVRGWSFTPATKDGQPVASEQEIVLHYERA